MVVRQHVAAPPARAGRDVVVVELRREVRDVRADRELVLGREHVARAEQRVVRGRVLQQLLGRVDVAVVAAERRRDREPAARVHVQQQRARGVARFLAVRGRAELRRARRRRSCGRSRTGTPGPSRRFDLMRSAAIVSSSSVTLSHARALATRRRKMVAYGSRVTRSRDRGQVDAGAEDAGPGQVERRRRGAGGPVRPGRTGRPADHRRAQQRDDHDPEPLPTRAPPPSPHGA